MTTIVPAEPRTDPRRRLPHVAGARLSPQEMERLREAAQERGRSVSDFVRGLILDATSA